MGVGFDYPRPTKKGEKTMSDIFSIELSHHHTAVCVSHWETSAEFYKQLGFTVANDWYWPDGVKNHKSLLRFGDKPDCWLELFEYPDGKGELTDDYTDLPGCVYRFALEVDGREAVDELYELALSAGGKEAEAPHEVILQGLRSCLKIREATVSGPDGEHITFLYEACE